MGKIFANAGLLYYENRCASEKGTWHTSTVEQIGKFHSMEACSPGQLQFSRDGCVNSSRTLFIAAATRTKCTSSRFNEGNGWSSTTFQTKLATIEALERRFVNRMALHQNWCLQSKDFLLTWVYITHKAGHTKPEYNLVETGNTLLCIQQTMGVQQGDDSTLYYLLKQQCRLLLKF